MTAQTKIPGICLFTPKKPQIYRKISKISKFGKICHFFRRKNQISPFFMLNPCLNYLKHTPCIVFQHFFPKGTSVPQIWTIAGWIFNVKYANMENLYIYELFLFSKNWISKFLPPSCTLKQVFCCLWWYYYLTVQTEIPGFCLFTPKKAQIYRKISKFGKIWQNVSFFCRKNQISPFFNLNPC